MLHREKQHSPASNSALASTGIIVGLGGNFRLEAVITDRQKGCDV